MKKIVIAALSIFTLGYPISLLANLKLPSIFNDGMVLQRESSAAIWGLASANTKVEILTSWNNNTYTTYSDKQGAWKINVATPKAGGPYQLLIKDDQSKITLGNVLIGEVWLASGQSNMAMPMKGLSAKEPVLHSDSILAAATNNQIRFFIAPQTSWAQPMQEYRQTKWQTANPTTVKNFSAVAYTFASELQQKLKIPVGIIQVAWGGTFIQSWMSAKSLEAFPEVKLLPENDVAFEDKNTPAGLFNGMISPLIGYGIKGAIWYQGEQNVRDPKLYARLFPLMVKDWRSLWGQNFAFYYAQIAPWDYKSANQKAAWLREVQLNSLKEIPNAGMAVLTDIGMENTIHPPDKLTVGQRLSYLALQQTYGQTKVKAQGPEFHHLKIKGSRLFLTFKFADGLYLTEPENNTFEVAGVDQVFYPATVSVSKGKMVLSSPKVPKPIAARYAYKGWVKGNLYNKYGLPASSFRTDNWDK
ncbi:sialate O-acetylesterase [Pedobacter nanyangensis]|uniref:sialate O-acetylesterase n=1 Tax=Pedobacter nanyangensis TaxID=1562389 RepID=UPI000DE35BDF|nr:sialate O-acetylesterase [Pedobacter nanyangensis]